MLKFISLFAVLGLASLSFAETSASSGSTTATVSASEPEIHGSLEARPSYTSTSGEFHTENTLDASVTLQPNLKLGYIQYFNTNLYTPKVPSQELGLIATDGFANIKLNEILQDSEYGLKFNYEGRVYMPTNAQRRNAGLITELRNYFKVEKKVNDTLTLSLFEVPVIFAFNKSGVGTSANPNFQNRVYFIADINIIDKVVLSVPLMLHNTHVGDHPGAVVGVGSATWQHYLWMYPEITYEAAPNITVGLAYYSDNLINDDMSGLRIGEGLEKGVFQTIVKASF